MPWHKAYMHQVVCKPNWDRDGKAAPFRRNDVLLNFLPKGLVAFPWIGHHQQYDRQGAQDRNPRPSRRCVTAPFRVGPPPSHGGGRPLFYAAVHKVTAHGGALRATANRASLRSLAARRSSNDASPPHGTALPRHRRTRALKRRAIAENHPPLQTSLLAYPEEPPRRTRRSSNAASLASLNLIYAVVRLRTDHCLLPTPWTSRPQQPSFPTTRPCPETSADCAP